MNRRGFTLIELILALAGCAVILAAVYGIFARAVKLRDAASERTREVRARAHAISTLRNDLLNARLSGGLFASVLIGSLNSPGGGFPGYLRFTTTTARDDREGPAEDLQEVEYYITTDPAASGRRSGRLVRTVQRELLTEIRTAPTEQPLLSGVSAMELSFLNDTDWQDTWEYDEENNPEVPRAVRVRLRFAGPDGEPAGPPVELITPWLAQLP